LNLKASSRRNILIYHDHLHIRGGAERVLSYFLSLFEEVKFPYTVLTLTKIETFNSINKLANKKPEKFVSLEETDILYAKIFYLLRTLIHIKATRKPRLLLITKGVPAIHFTSLVGYIFKDVDIKIVRLPDIYGLNILTGYSSLLNKKHKFSLLPAKILNRVLVKSNSFCDAYFLANSPEMRNDIVKLFPNLKDRVKVLYPVFDDTFFYPRSDLRENDVILVGRIHPSKNTHRALDILAEVKKSKRNIRLYIVGDIGDRQYYEYVKGRILNLDLQNNVSMVTDGRPEVIRKYMWRSKICWNLSEGYFGISNVECLACGVIPIVLPNQRSSVGPFVQLTLNLLNAPSDPLNMNRAYNWAKTNFSPSAFYSNLTHILKQLGIREEKIDFLEGRRR